VGFKPLEDHVLVNSMNTHGDDVVALEAIKKSDLATRMVKKERGPLQNITNTAAVAHRSTHVGVKAELQEPRTSMPLSVLRSSRPAIVPNGAPQSSQNTQLVSMHELAWIDFNCERRDLLRRVKFRSTAEEVKEMNDTILAEWLQLKDGQIEFFGNRAHRIAAKLSGPGGANIQRFTSTSQGFWWYYYDEFYREKYIGADPHRSFETTQTFFDKRLACWLVMESGFQHTYLYNNLSFLERNPIQPMPQRLSGLLDVPTFGAKHESSPDPNASFEVSESMASHSVKKQEDDHESSPLSASQATEEEETATSRLNIPDLFTGCSPEQLEKGVEKGVAILVNLRTALAVNGNTDNTEAAQWLQSIENVHKQAVRTRTVIGVVGNTGAGKSSVINALLDEERLLPTNCMRACTAVITEISYNYDSTAYMAEIEFISADDWRVELETLFKDLLDGTGNISRECTNEDSEAGVAYAKIKAVYPKLTKDDISNSSVDELMRHGNVSRLLGASRSIEETDSLIFYKKLQSFVDSKEKTTKSGKDMSDKEKSKPREMEFWPLIKVVRLYVRAPALSTGAVIVDLPGVHDSNQARAAVAQNYMKQCTGLWICAPINRAVDDKAAKSLLGETFKRQLKMDGGYSTVTFICSKTDDISLMEAQDSLGIEEELAELWNKCDDLSKKKRALKKELDRLKETKSNYSQVMEAADEELEIWEKLKDDFDDGKTVYPPTLKKKRSEKKRKRGRPKNFFAKKARLDVSDDDFIDDSSQSDRENAGDEDSAVGSEHEEPAEPLMEDKILEKIGDLRATKKDGRQQRAQIDNEIKNIRSQMQEVEKEHDAAEAVISQKCIQGRNEYSKGAIQQDFAAGIKELDMEIREEEDAANFNPENDIRDYDEVARSLPVFTVSSRAYQKLMGRLVKDKGVPGFTTVEETQIPQLQEHAKKTTEAGRQANCRRFLNSMSQLLNSLRLWASSDGSSSNLTELQKSQEAKILKEKLGKLDNVSFSSSMMFRVHPSVLTDDLAKASLWIHILLLTGRCGTGSRKGNPCSMHLAHRRSPREHLRPLLHSYPTSSG
jgi:GTPase SAR1 family protein